MDPDQLRRLDGTSVSSSPATIEVENLNEWIFDSIRPYVKGRCLEIGNGIDEISPLFVQNDIAIHLSGSTKDLRDKLREKYIENPTVRGIHNFDFNQLYFKDIYHQHLGKFGTVLKLNHFKHEPIDPITIANVNSLLRERGHLIMQAPSYTALYDDLNDDWKEFKQLNHTAFKNILGRGFEILNTQYFFMQGNTATNTMTHGGLSVIVIARKLEN